MHDDSWRHDVLEAMERLVGSDQTAKIAAEWFEHAARDKVEVTFLGPYSSGKSTLLRRLVVDGGVSVPEWLTVSARRETFELNAIDVGDLTFTDAPGFAAGNERHDELAQDALSLSDVFLLVVPPQLLTTNRELVGSIVCGRYFFGQQRSGGEQVVIAVVAQADSMGIDPDDDVDGMRQLAARKRVELVAQLEDSAGAPLPDLQVFSVAADPYEEQARHAQPARSAFDPYRAWDGVDALQEALATLTERSDELRRWAEVRYFSRMAGAVAVQARTVIDELRASADELRAREAEWSQQKERVGAVVDAARSGLQTTLVMLAGALGDELGVDDAESRARIDEHMSAALDQWVARWDGHLDLVLGEAKVQVDDRLSRPRSLRTEEFLRSLTRDPDAMEAPQPNTRVVGLLRGTKVELDKIARGAFEVNTGRSFKQLVDEGRRAKSRADAAHDLSTAELASQRAAKAAHTLDGCLQIADSVMAVVSMLDAERRQRQEDAERRRQREAARDAIERNAELVSIEVVDGDGVQPGWRARADAALELLREQLALTGDEGAVDELVQTVAAQEQSVSDLEGLVARGPGSPLGRD